MKYILAIAILFLFCFQPAQIAPAQVQQQPQPAMGTLKKIIQIQEQQIQDNKDSISALTKGILSGEIKPKTIVKYRYRTKIKEVHDTIWMPVPTDVSEYIQEPCPDTIVVQKITVPPIKKRTLLQRIFKQ